MKDLSSRYGNLWIRQESTQIESLEVVATNRRTVQLCVGIRDFSNTDPRSSTVFDELLLELDTMAAGELAEKLAAVAFEIEKSKATTASLTHN